MKRVVGLDLSLSATGLSDGRTTWVQKSTGHRGDTLAQRAQRLEALAGRILADTGRPDLVVIEQPAYASTTGSMHDRSGLWWLVVGRLRHDGTSVAEVTPGQIKIYATGKGTAEKGAVIDAASRRLPDVDTGGNDNRADALWAAALGHAHLGQPLLDLPLVHRRALDKVSWPDLMDAAAHLATA